MTHRRSNRVARPPAGATDAGDARYIVLKPGREGIRAEVGKGLVCTLGYVIRRENRAYPDVVLLQSFDALDVAEQYALESMRTGEIRRVWWIRGPRAGQICDVEMAALSRDPGRLPSYGR